MPVTDCDCGYVPIAADGIIDALDDGARRSIDAFLESYTTIRHAEGRGSDGPKYYRDLPFCSQSDPLYWEWGIRRRSFERFRKTVLRIVPAGGSILDLGAGTGWLSNRLALDGFSPCAVDLSLDERDGLRAARHFKTSFPRLRATFDTLPLADNCADMVLFNASLHYASDLFTTLREAIRVMKPGGRLIILDTPIYRDEQSGHQMIAERHDSFEQNFGDRSDRLPSIGFLTWSQVRIVETELNLSVRAIRTWYGAKWALRPVLAKLRGTREPAAFVILSATVRSTL